MAPDENDLQEKAERVGMSLYPRHIRIIRQFAEETQRSDSNAVQFILEDWKRLKREAIHESEPAAV